MDAFMETLIKDLSESVLLPLRDMANEEREQTEQKEQDPNEEKNAINA